MLDAFIWFIAVEILGLIALPFTFVLFKRLPDRGYAFGKALSIVVVSFILWFASSFFLPNTQWAIFLIIGILAAGSFFLFWRRRQDIKTYIAENRTVIITTETIFLVAFVFWAVVRAYNSNIIYGEKLMDIAYINAIVKSDHFPPYNPWLSGHTISYYYFGHMMVATLTKFTGIASSVTYNLALSLFFALAAIGSFGIVYNLVRLVRGSVRAAIGFGVAAASLVILLSNLEGLLEIIHSHGIGSQDFWAWVDIKDLKESNPPYESTYWYPGDNDHWWWWRASRVVGTHRMDYTINEYPFWSFFFADLHAHLMVIPFVLLNMAVGLELLLSPLSLGLKWLRRHWSRVLVFAICLGSLIFLNAWDFPTYAFLFIITMAIAGYLSRHRLDPRNFAYDRWTLPLFALVLVGLAIPIYFLPLPLWATISGITILIIIAAIILLLVWRQRSGLKGFIYRHRAMMTTFNVGIIYVILAGLAILLYLPFINSMLGTTGSLITGEVEGAGKGIILGIAPYGGVDSRYFHMFLFWGVFLFAGISFVLAQAWDTVRKRNIGRWLIAVAVALPILPWIIWAGTVNWTTVANRVGSGYIYALEKFGHLLPFLIVLTLILVIAGKKIQSALKEEDATERASKLAPVFALMLLFIGFLIIMGCELFYLNDRSSGEYERVTTVFKLYLQAWIFLGIGSAFGLYHLATRWRPRITTVLGLTLVISAIFMAFVLPSQLPAIICLFIGGFGLLLVDLMLLINKNRWSIPLLSQLSSTAVAVANSITTRFRDPRRRMSLAAVGAVLALSAPWIWIAAPSQMLTMVFQFIIGCTLLSIGTTRAQKVKPASRTKVQPTREPIFRKSAHTVWWLALLLLFIGSCIFTPASILSTTRAFTKPATLNGIAYVERNDPSEYEAIQWLNAEVEGTPVIVEAVSSYYGGGFRISSYTGLPTIVGRYGKIPWWLADEGEKDREQAAETIYTSNNSAEVQGVLDKYDVTYVYIGQRERNKYGANVGENLSDFMDVAFENKGVIIYTVRED